MMIHALDLHGCRAGDAARDACGYLARSHRVRGLRPPGGGSRRRQIELKVADKSDSKDLSPQARGRAAGRARPVRKPGPGAGGDRGRRRDRRRQAGREGLRGHRRRRRAVGASPRIPLSRAAASSWRARWNNIRSRSRTMSASTSAHRPAASPKCCWPTARAWCSPSMSATASCIPRCTATPRSCRWKRPISAASKASACPRGPTSS